MYFCRIKKQVAMNSINDTRRMAVLIDGDNAESRLIEQTLAEVGKHGKATVKRVYGDWSQQTLKGWKDATNAYAIRPIQKFAYTVGKNSTDTALIIDAMDLLHSGNVDGFCIVSSDSDYTGIAQRIREEGCFIMGIGRSHTPQAFVKACEVFVFTEIFTGQANAANNQLAHPQSGNETSDSDFILIDSLKSDCRPLTMLDIDNAYDIANGDGNDKALLSVFGTALRQIDPAFSHKNYGFSSLRKFCESLQPHYRIIVAEDGVTLSIRKNNE